ncbi:hypothetical protein PLESTB_000616300 [Pleodorina starrii]|uniref:Uncharacterized protein n=1 Tax=Pleodorina starrii TaxID=330485 RepID=A0A9W6BHL1_9CHLO|nr:hypothetical protein PLESTB_000616300 [Pleodorina starrii]GLC68007.1 hypothetical protein PLESTF_000633900 [Pleodorina starrii]
MATLDMPYRYGSDPRTDDGSGDGGGAARWTPPPPPADSGHDDDGAADGGGGSGDGGSQGGAAAVPSGGGGGGGDGDGGGGPLSLGMSDRPPVWEMPALPNAEWPSDHVAVGAELLLLLPSPLAAPLSTSPSQQ